MDLSRRPPSFFLLLLLMTTLSISNVGGTGVFKVKRKFVGRHHRSVADLRKHDLRRHSRILAAATPAGAIDLPLGGIGLPTEAGLYYAQIGIGTPAKNYYVQVDTGSDLLWVNCISCSNCPRKSNLGIELTLYDPKSSSSGSPVACDDRFCYIASGGESPQCYHNLPCGYRVMYGDGSSSGGIYVKDVVTYNQVSADHRTLPANASISFGCGAQQSGDLGSSSEALDGILGFGQANSSMLSQLASSGKVRKEFAHCLDTENGGGIFAIGHVVQPKVQTTPLVPDQPHYNVNMKSIEVGGNFLQLPTDLFENGENRGTIIDSGTTLAYLPDAAYKSLLDAIFSSHQSLDFFTVQDFQCFRYSGSVDDGFPLVTLHFDKSLSLRVHPHDYFFQNDDDVWCVGWQNGGEQSSDGKYRVLLGDLALSNKLVVYDLVNQAIGWTEYNCSSSIKIQDDKTGAMYIVDAYSLSSAMTLEVHKFILLLLLFISCYLIY